MEKRALLAIVLTFIVLILYDYFFIRYQDRQVQKDAKVEEKEELKLLHPVKPIVSVAPVTPFEGKDIVVETELYSAVFTTKGGTLKYYEIKNYKDKEGRNVVLLKEPGIKPPLGIGSSDDFELSGINFAVYAPAKGIKLDRSNTEGSLIFEYKSQGVAIKRTFTFRNDDYAINVKDEVLGLSDYWITIGSDFGIHEKDGLTHTGPVLLQENDRIEFTAKKLNEARSYKGSLRWIAQEDKYFFAALVPLTNVEEAKVWKEKDSPLIAFRGTSGENSFILYAGPKEYDRLKTLKVGLEHIIDFGFFSVIAVPLFWILKFFYKLLGNYGWAIVLLTFITRIPFIPLINKSQRSMKRMQQLHPRITEIREKYKKDPKRMQKELMELYRREKVNPLAGCLPILLQLPIFFALYKILLIAIELRGAPFVLWVKDLSVPDSFFGHIPSSFPLIGGLAIGLLPILMGITMIIQQKMTPTSLDPRYNQIMMLMPIVFTFIFMNFASGLVLYWFMNNVFSIVQQLYVNWKMAKEAA